MNRNEKKEQDLGKMLSSNRWRLFWPGGLLCVLMLLLFMNTCYEFRQEREEIAIREVRNTAESVTDWTDRYFALADDADMSVWELGVELRTDPGQGVVVLDRQGQIRFSTDPLFTKLCHKMLDEPLESPILMGGGVIFLL